MERTRRLDSQSLQDWTVTQEKVEAAIHRIVDIIHPRKLILFGSYVCGGQHQNSDLDILVITGDHIDNPRRESVRIRRALRDIGMSMDILVVPESRWDELKERPGLVYREVHRNGRVVYAA